MVTKKTEIGALPSDWNVVTLLDCLCGKPSYGINAPAIAYSPQKPRYIRITDITEAGTYSKSSPASVEGIDIDRYYLKENDIVLARTGASVGKSYLYQKDDGNLVYAGFLIKASINDIVADARYVFACLHTQRYWQWVNTISVRSGQPGINGEEYSTYLLPLPPRPEQAAIAGALSDVDNLISSLQQLIEKKRAIKKGAMQELLTGKKRLPGFSEEWSKQQLGDICNIVNGGTPSTSIAEFWNGKILWCTPTDITSCSTKYIYTTESKITESGLKASSATLLPKGALLLCSRATIGEVRIAGNTICTNQGFKSLVVHQNISNEWLYYMVHVLKSNMLEKAIGSTFLEISKKDLAELDIVVPEFTEQKAIAQVLSDMDSEIEQLEKNLAKYQQIKQGMMQELLTGRIRLVDVENNE